LPIRNLRISSLSNADIGFTPEAAFRLLLSDRDVAAVVYPLKREALPDVDEANLSESMKWLVRGSIPVAAILVPAAFFLSMLSPDAKAPHGLIYLAYAGAALLALGVLVLGIGLVRRPT
jgi:hypothetical protein